MIVTNIYPSGTVSVNDDLWHIAMSDNSGQTNFKYVFDVYANNEQLVRCKVYPDVNNGRGYFNASNVLKNEITIDYFSPPNTPAFVSQQLDDSDFKVEYVIEVGEDYNLGFSGITDIGLASGTITAYNYLPSLWKRRQQDLSKYLNGLVSNRPRVLSAGTDENVFIGLGTDSNFNFTFKKYNSNNQLVTQVSLSRSISNYPILNIGRSALLNTFSGSITGGISATDYYDLEFANDKIRVNMLCDNQLHEPLLLHFVNAYGFMDTARFGCANKLNMAVNRKSYNKQEFEFNPTSVNYYTNNVYRESKINYYQDISWNYKLMMDYPTDDEYEWLSELIYSPLVYLEYDGAYYPVTIKNTNYEYIKRISSKLRTLEVEIEINQNRNGFIR